MGKLELQLEQITAQLQAHIGEVRDTLLGHTDEAISFLESRLVALEQKQDFMVAMLCKIASTTDAKGAPPSQGAPKEEEQEAKFCSSCHLTFFDGYMGTPISEAKSVTVSAEVESPENLTPGTQLSDDNIDHQIGISVATVGEADISRSLFFCS